MIAAQTPPAVSNRRGDRRLNCSGGGNAVFDELGDEAEAGDVVGVIPAVTTGCANAGRQSVAPIPRSKGRWGQLTRAAAPATDSARSAVAV